MAGDEARQLAGGDPLGRRRARGEHGHGQAGLHAAVNARVQAAQHIYKVAIEWMGFVVLHGGYSLSLMG